MKKRQKKWKLLALFLLLFIAASAYAIKNPAIINRIPNFKIEQPEPTAGQLSSACTNPEPLKHVYNPGRLVVIDPCNPSPILPRTSHANFIAPSSIEVNKSLMSSSLSSGMKDGGVWM